MDNNLSFLSTRKGFNVSLRHFKFVNKLIKKVEKGSNLADLINDSLEDKQVSQNQFAAILNALLIDKYGYYCESVNLKISINENLINISNQTSSWDKVDIVLTYFHPQLGQILINPKNENHWESVGQIKENELIVIYAGNSSGGSDVDLHNKAAKALKSILNGEKPSNVKAFKSGDSDNVPEKPQEIKKEVVEPKSVKEQPTVKTTAPSLTQAPINAGAKKKLSPHYGVIVSNELFHNGNVEAWKKIIASYDESKYSDTKVLVFYEGEQIQDINTLFKWGKVKHGTNIYFALLGPEFRDISKIRRYLAQGASNRFEDFLRGDPTKTLALF